MTGEKKWYELNTHTYRLDVNVERTVIFQNGGSNIRLAYKDRIPQLIKEHIFLATPDCIPKITTNLLSALGDKGITVPEGAAIIKERVPLCV